MPTDDNRTVVHVETPADKAVFEAMNTWHNMKEENERLRAGIAQWEGQYQKVEQENAMLRALNQETASKMNYYQRHSTELATRLVDIQRVIEMALSDARMAGYKPPASGQPRPQGQPQPQARPQAPQAPQASPQPAPARLPAPHAPGPQGSYAGGHDSPPDDGKPIPQFLRDRGTGSLENDIAALTHDITQPRPEDRER